MRKILILGCVGSGKTTLAQKLSDKLKIKNFSTDKMVYNDNWLKNPKEVRDKRLKNTLDNKQWIIEGRYSGKWMNQAIGDANKIILLNYPKKVIFTRILKRFSHGTKEKTAYGKIWSISFLLINALFYNPSRDYMLIKSMKKKMLILCNIDEELEFLK